MTREFDFVVASVRRFFRPETLLPSREGLDWTAAVELANRHGVAGFLGRVRETPDPPASGLETARSNLALSAELVKLADFFSKEHVEMVALKGPVLGAALYQDEVLKASTDLDLLVRRCDGLRAKRLLESIGYRLLTVPHWEADSAYLRNINDELAFRDPSSWLKLDLHWNLLPGYFPSPLKEAQLWANVRSIPWGNTRIQTLSPEHQVMFLSAHGAKHLWARLGWLCDLARLVQLERRIDWPAVFDQCRSSHTTRMILVGLLLADQLLGVNLPEAASALVAADPRARALAASVVERIRTDRPASHVATAAFGVRVLERTGQRARLLLGMFVQPTEAEYQVLQLPPSLYGAYYVLRPLRLAAKHSWRLAGLRDRRALETKKA